MESTTATLPGVLEREDELSEKIKETLKGISSDVSNFVLSLNDNLNRNPAECVQEINRAVSEVDKFEIFYVHDSVAFPGQYDVYIRRNPDA